MSYGTDVRDDLRPPSLGVWARECAKQAIIRRAKRRGEDIHLIDNEELRRNRVDVGGESTAGPDLEFQGRSGRFCVDVKGKTFWAQPRGTLEAHTGLDTKYIDEYERYSNHYGASGGVVFVQPTGYIKNPESPDYNELVGVYFAPLEAIRLYGERGNGCGGKETINIPQSRLERFHLGDCPRFVLGRINYYPGKLGSRHSMPIVTKSMNWG